MADIPTIPPDLDTWLRRLVRLHEIHEIFGVRDVTVKRWRWAALSTSSEETSWSCKLPPPVLLPEPLRRLVACSLWDRATLLEWGRQTGRLDLNDKPIRLPPTGRPKTKT